MFLGVSRGEQSVENRAVSCPFGDFSNIKRKAVAMIPFIVYSSGPLATFQNSQSESRFV